MFCARISLQALSEHIVVSTRAFNLSRQSSPFISLLAFFCVHLAMSVEVLVEQAKNPAWFEKLAGLKTFIERNGRQPSQLGDAEEKALYLWKWRQSKRDTLTRTQRLELTRLLNKKWKVLPVIDKKRSKSTSKSQTDLATSAEQNSRDQKEKEEGEISSETSGDH